MQDLLQTLTCPITLELIDDPVQVPCCGKSVSRNPLAIALQFRAVCPLCRADLSSFDVGSAPPNRVLSAIIDSIRQSSTQESNVKEHQWSGEVAWLQRTGASIGRLTLRLSRSHFTTKRTLFVAVVDKSGSMSGSPWRQVQTALVHILGLTSVKMASVETRIITYSSTADLLPGMTDPSQLPLATSQIGGIQAGGGTNFLCAYQKLSELLESVRSRADSFSSVSVAFLTDGQAQNDKSTLTTALSRLFTPFESAFRIVVHAIGFSQDCDKKLLEQMRTAGTTEGTFRYAEPTDDSDALCGKLTDLFTLSERAATAPVNITLPDGLALVRSGESAIHVDPVSRTGSLNEWIRVVEGDPPSRFAIRLNSSEDKDVEIAITVESCGDPAVIELWLRRVLDGMADELLELSRKRASISQLILRLHTALYASRLKTIRLYLDDPRVNALQSQLDAIAEGRSVNEGRLADMRFSSLFAAPVAKPQTQTRHAEVSAQVERPTDTKSIVYVELPVRYSHNHTGTNRNAVQRAVMDGYPRRRDAAALAAIEAATDDDLLFCDGDGNTVLHLAAYCGSDAAISKILGRFPVEDVVRISQYVNLTNVKNETAMTLAIKRRGFHDSLLLLNGAGCILPSTRVEPLKRFCIAHGFVRTADILTNMNTTNSGVQFDLAMTPEYVTFQWESVKRRGTPRFARDWLQIALAKCLQDIVIELLTPESRDGFAIPWQWLIDYCLPPKPDHPETPKYITLATAILDAEPSLLFGRDPTTGDTSLIWAVQKGSLPHVQLFLDRGAPIDETNMLGNSALWVACAKRYPCIVGELIGRHADMNLANEKGNRPLSAVCQMGPAKIAQLLIAAGAEVTFMNRNGDTPLLLACRNGQSDVAKLLLDYCDSDFVHFRAEIDGFDALFASVESDRPDCVRLIHEYGVSLEERTSEDNAILRSATPLHLAAYYGRHSSAQLLLQLGADPNSRDANGMTPLHIAVLRKHHPIIELLINKKADPFIVDKSGNPPASFARDPKVLALLVNPLTAPLHELCAIRPRSSSGFTIDEVQDLLTTKAAVPGLTNPATVIADARDHRGMSPLATAVVHGNFEVVEILLSLGLDSTIPDSRGMSAQMWAQWTKNPRIQRLLNVPTQDFPQTERIRTAAKASPEAMALLFLGDPQPPALIASSLSLRMSLLSTLSPVVDSVLSMRRQIVYDCSSTDLMTIYASQNGRTSADASFIQQQLKKVSALSFWQAKIEAVSAIGAACTESLLPAQLVALFLYSCDPVICELVSYYLTGRCASDDAELQSTIFPLIKSLLTAVNSLPPFAAEVYAASLNIDRSVFPIGAVVSSPLLLSATSLWPIAVESLNFEKEGTVFIIKSSNAGRMIATHSRFPFESEVLFPAETKFVVTQWYKGDVIALGQPNIREHTFGLNEEQRVTYAGTRKPLIIELKEV